MSDGQNELPYDDARFLFALRQTNKKKDLDGSVLGDRKAGSSETQGDWKDGSRAGFSTALVDIIAKM
ncbi:hypothetical protein PG993_002230 [Apiospora rasikravindrae]|uniref:Uncharacterized protein n=1 Tax=Apiospora rasikravindrae TaxID=990691 RepID=A0ABR1TW15_9PEZI